MSMSGNALPAGGQEQAPLSVEQFPIDRVHAFPGQPRRHFAEERLRSLAASLSQQGTLQPVLVRPHPQREGHYELIAGERRLRAMRMLGWSHVPALVRSIPEAQLLEVALVENLQRESLTPLEEAQAYRMLMERHGHTQEALARRLGRERSTIANSLRLIGLPLGVREALEAERITAGHARALLGVPWIERQIALCLLIEQRGLSVREVERIARRERILAGKSAAPKRPSPAAPVSLPPSSMLEDARLHLERHLGAQVQLDWNPPVSGCLSINFYSLEAFQSLYDTLLGRIP